jgi:hypothetical protein
LLTVFLWFGGEIAGAVVGLVLSDGKEILLVYGCAIGGAICGAVLAYIIASCLPDQNAKDDDDDRPRRRRPSTVDRGRDSGVPTAGGWDDHDMFDRAAAQEDRQEWQEAMATYREIARRSPDRANANMAAQRITELQRWLDGQQTS